jgi:hypothetical protein
LKSYTIGKCEDFGHPENSKIRTTKLMKSDLKTKVGESPDVIYEECNHVEKWISMYSPGFCDGFKVFFLYDR